MAPNSDLVRKYNLYRKRGMELNNKLMKSLDGDLLLEAAEQLGIVDKSGTIVFESEDESDVLMDFALNDYREDGRSVAELYREKPGGEDEVERELLDGLAAAYTSLFRVGPVSKEHRTVELEDVLDEKGTVQIIDNGLSMAPARHTLLFLRVIPLKDFNMSSGVSFIFPEETRARMLRAYDNFYSRVKADNDATRRYVAFFKAGRIFGKKGIYI